MLDLATFKLEIRRESILDDSLDSMVNQHVDKFLLRQPLFVNFKDEGAIDAGGVKKEYF